tara:strand:- start:200 stop:517 length:318 start_codon:yes stop_codon:yes gene_type:complete
MRVAKAAGLVCPPGIFTPTEGLAGATPSGKPDTCLALAQDAAAGKFGRFAQHAGGDIMFHGRGPESRKLAPKNRDWTVGCIAFTDKEIEDVYAMLQLRTPVMIYA